MFVWLLKSMFGITVVRLLTVIVMMITGIHACMTNFLKILHVHDVYPPVWKQKLSLLSCGSKWNILRNIRPTEAPPTCLPVHWVIILIESLLLKWNIRIWVLIPHFADIFVTCFVYRTWRNGVQVKNPKGRQLHLETTFANKKITENVFCTVKTFDEYKIIGKRPSDEIVRNPCVFVFHHYMKRFSHSTYF